MIEVDNEKTELENQLLSWIIQVHKKLEVFRLTKWIKSFILVLTFLQ
jgi:hypothetical protein